MPNGDIYELTVRSTYASQNIVNVHHFVQNQADGTGTAEDSLDEIWQAGFKIAFADLFTAEMNVVDLSIRRIKPTQTQPTVYPVSQIGSFMGDGLPPQCCALVRQSAEPAGRKGSGSVKICCVPLTETHEGRISAAYATLMNTYGAKFVPEYVATTGYRFNAAVYSQIDNVARPILKAGAASRIRTVHSRQIGVGD